MNKGSDVNKGVFIAVIAVVAIVVCFLGYKMFLAPSSSLSSSSRQQQMQHMSSGPTTYAPNSGGAPGGNGTQ